MNDPKKHSIKVLILGGAGMLGHKAYETFSAEFDTFVTFRSYKPILDRSGIFRRGNVIEGVDIEDAASVQRVLRDLRPNVVLNCVGIIKQLREAHDPKLSIYTNALFPHLLRGWCQEIDCRLIHVSTDCVFSGDRGMYRDDDHSDAQDLYGRTKYLGEVAQTPALTIRTSIIGHGILPNPSLMDWFLSQRDKTINGYQKAIFSGFPTVVLCREMIRLVKDFPDLCGTYNVSSEPISKFELLNVARSTYNISVDIQPDAKFACDRSLDSSRYRELTGFAPASWASMVTDMHADYTSHAYYRKTHETEK